MNRIEMIRCAVRSPHQGENAHTGEKSLRYVPSEIFRLWRYLMENVKNFEITDVVTGIWLDEEMFTRERDLYGTQRSDMVVEVSFTYTRDTKIGRPVIRYFPQERFEAIASIFLKNFSSEYIQGGPRQTQGRFIPLA